MKVAQPLPIGRFFFLWKLPPLALPRLLVHLVHMILLLNVRFH